MRWLASLVILSIIPNFCFVYGAGTDVSKKYEKCVPETTSVNPPQTLKAKAKDGKPLEFTIKTLIGLNEAKPLTLTKKGSSDEFHATFHHLAVDGECKYAGVSFKTCGAFVKFIYMVTFEKGKVKGKGTIKNVQAMSFVSPSADKHFETELKQGLTDGKPLFKAFTGLINSSLEKYLKKCK